MPQEIVPAQSFFDRNFGIGTGDLEKVIATAVGKKADYADLYFEYRRNEGISLEEGLVKNCAQSTANGVGVRVVAEAKTGYAYTDDITIENLELAARTARYIAQDRESLLAIPVRQAILNLSARDAPAGTMDVVLGPGWPGILLHEAIGHGLEGDFNRKKTSAFTDRIGQRVASELCTVVDDGTIPSRRGSINVDNEGTPTHRTVLIEKGMLKGYLQDRLNASLMKMPLTGNGRRESYAHIPMPRMTNTFMLAGESAPEDIIRSVKKGLYAVSFGGGQVDITSGKFVFSASHAQRIQYVQVTR